MVQVSDSVGTAMKGSMNALFGSGMASMSEASMDFQPRMEEPSKPKPSLKTSSVSSLMGTLKCCQVPKVSTNFTSTIFAPAFLAISITLLGVLMFSVGLVLVFLASRGHAGATCLSLPGMTLAKIRVSLWIWLVASIAG